MATEKNRLRELVTSSDGYGWIIELDHQVIGAVEINQMAKWSQHLGCPAGSLSILIGDRAKWGQGIAGRVESLVTGWAFEQSPLMVLVARADPANIASWRSLERLGYRMIRVEQDDSGNRPQTWRIYELPKASWRPRKAA
jgi:RimJ/RimL family protein N-acetyltransferase